MVVAFDSDMTPSAIQQQFRQIEDAHGRIRESNKFAARLLDIDLILYGDQICDEEGVKLPRIDVVKYAFVLLPLVQLEPEGIHPVLKASYARLWQDYDGDRQLEVVDLAIN
jgi:2-amino-4-hydroxy-6-hydroxymethyldihydropteridine diphosphokinase